MRNEAVYEHSPGTRRRVTEILSRAEIRQLTARSNAWGFWAVASTWAAIVACFSLLAWSLTQPWFVSIPLALLGVALLGGRQLALAILTHEASHKTLFASAWANDVVGDWLCGRPIWLDMYKYREHHFIHHTKTGTRDDTDISLIEGLPTTRGSLLRKLGRDLLGITGLKFTLGRVLMDAGMIKWTVASNVERLPPDGRRWWHYLAALMANLAPVALVNITLFLALSLAGWSELYLAWLVAYLIPYPLFIRIRALAEHACTEPGGDMFRNTRTTRAGCLARVFVAPLHVNYHIEHHVMASVPFYRLPELHRLLRERGVVGDPPGYWQVLKIVSAKTAH